MSRAAKLAAFTAKLDEIMGQAVGAVQLNPMSVLTWGPQVLSDYMDILQAIEILRNEERAELVARVEALEAKTNV